MATCLVCRRDPATVGVACESCVDELYTFAQIAPEQVELHGEGSSQAVLVDRWGRALVIPPVAVIGRSIEEDGIAIIEGSVSRKHATLELVGEKWTLTDLRSANGTFVDGTQLRGSIQLRHGNHLRFGRIAMFFADGVDPSTIKRGVPAAQTVLVSDLRSPELVGRLTTEIPIPEDPDELSSLTIRLHQPSGGGGGVIEIEGTAVQLTVPQFELAQLLVERMCAEQTRAVDERGFVSTTELMSHLSLVAALPVDSHVRQVVMRLRRVLSKAGHGDLIESRYGIGYRIRATPR
jgi:hypothetical protein